MGSSRVAQWHSVSAALFLTCCASAAESADKVSLAITTEVRFTMEAPSGLCLVDAARSKLERELLAFQVRIFQGISKSLATFAECPAVKSMRAGRSVGSERWAAIVTPLFEGKVRAFPGAIRREVLEEMAQVLASETPDARIDEDALNRILSDGLKEAGSKSSAKVTFQKSLGVLALDEVAIFTGTLTRETINGRNRMMSGVSGATLIGEYIVGALFHRPFIDNGTYDILVTEARDALRALILRHDKESLLVP
jgi:hypothetical protein